MDSSSSCCVINVEEEVVVIRNGWTPKKEKKNVWNKLDPEVKCATTVSDLENKSKTQLLGNYIKE